MKSVHRKSVHSNKCYIHNALTAYIAYIHAQSVLIRGTHSVRCTGEQVHQMVTHTRSHWLFRSPVKASSTSHISQIQLHTEWWTVLGVPDWLWEGRGQMGLAWWPKVKSINLKRTIINWRGRQLRQEVCAKHARHSRAYRSTERTRSVRIGYSRTMYNWPNRGLSRGTWGP